MLGTAALVGDLLRRRCGSFRSARVQCALPLFFIDFLLIRFALRASCVGFGVGVVSEVA